MGTSGDGSMAGLSLRTWPRTDMKRAPTDEGEYRVAYVGRHASQRYPTWSKIPWGAALKEEKGELWVHYQGSWRLLSSVVPLTKDNVQEYYASLYRIRKVPFKGSPSGKRLRHWESGGRRSGVWTPSCDRGCGAR